MARGVLLLALTALLSCPTVWGVSKAFTRPEMLAQVPTRPHVTRTSALAVCLCRRTPVHCRRLVYSHSVREALCTSGCG
jgi:hypothetical protein